MTKTSLMGILNVTPDSFFDKGAYFSLEKAVDQGLRLAKEGADILDIGGESSRPGAEEVSLEEELRRVIPVIQALKHQLKIPLSIDTTKHQVAAAAIEAGASLINDISGFTNPAMQEIASSFHLDICIMHMQGTPRTMQLSPVYPDGIISTLLRWFEERIEELMRKGICKEKIILDPGIGFGKTVADNLKIIDNLHKFKALGFRLLLGISRKSFLAKIVGKPAPELLQATVVMNAVALMRGVDILRVHDVEQHRAMMSYIGI